MSSSDIQTILKEIEQRLAACGELPPEVELSIQQLLNVVEALCADKKSLADEVERLKSQLEQKKKDKTTAKPTQDGDPSSANDSNHSSEKRRRKRDKKRRPRHDRRSFKDLTIHETLECPVDPATLPPDAVRLEDESVVVQDIEIKPRNTRFARHVYYSAGEQRYFRGPLPSGRDAGDFGADLRALILSLKYCGNMSEPKIREFLENFDVQVSSGSVSNILTKTADSFRQEFDALVEAGLASTPYQQTDDTSARVKGKFWHTHILCNPFYAAYFTRPRKDRLTLCWIHAGRHYEKLSPVVPRHAALLDAFGERYWDFYQSLQDYRAGPSDSQASALRLEFDELFSTRTGYAALDERIAKTAAKKEELLTVLSEPSVPLHNNASELQARVSARRRDVSLHSRSEHGARAMDIFTTIVETSKKLGLSAYAYLRDRLSQRCEQPSLAESIRAAAHNATLQTASR